MTKRTVGWICTFSVLLAAGLWSVASSHGALSPAASVRRVLKHNSMARRVWNGLHRSLLVPAHAASTSQEITPRDPAFLQPQRLDAWRIIGPGGGGAFYYPVISPHDPNLVFATTDMTACYVSEN